MPELIDTMASRSDLEGFAHMLNGAMPDEKQGSHPRPQTTRSVHAATSGLTSPASGNEIGYGAARSRSSAPQWKEGRTGDLRRFDLR